MCTPSTGNSGDTSSSTSSSKPLSEACEFKNGMCCDTSVFTELKHDKDYTSWNDNTITQAASQCVEDVLDKTFVPSAIDSEVQEPFSEQQKDMMFQ